MVLREDLQRVLEQAATAVGLPPQRSRSSSPDAPPAKRASSAGSSVCGYDSETPHEIQNEALYRACRAYRAALPGAAWRRRARAARSGCWSTATARDAQPCPLSPHLSCRNASIQLHDILGIDDQPFHVSRDVQLRCFSRSSLPGTAGG